jgi:asparagine synthase (glutamine-hydrolysing)
VELALAIPTYVLTRGGQGRALARRAFADALPPAIAARSTKGTTGQAVADVLARHRSALRSLLLDGELARLKLIDRSRVDLAASGRATARETPAADLLALVAAEAWLRSWSNGSTVEPATPSPA